MNAARPPESARAAARGAELASCAAGPLDSPADLRIGDFLVGPRRPTFVVAEIGVNHNGSVELAKRLVDAAIEAGADCAKFQLRGKASLYAQAGDAAYGAQDLGAQYTLDMLARVQLPDERMFEVFDHCRARGILPLCTPWDLESLAALERYGMPAFKLASASLTNPELVDAAARLGKPIIASTGMSTEEEIAQAVRWMRERGASFVLMHCNSTYPAPFKDIHLEYLDRLRRIGGCTVGYSGHERGIAVAVAAVAKGARVIEKHFTLDRGMEGNDHRVSLLPGEFRTLVDMIREVELALGSDAPRRVTQGEMMNRSVLGTGLAARRGIAAGERIEGDMIEVRSPGKGLPAYRRPDLVGRRARRALRAGDFFHASDVDDLHVEPRAYRFERRFGIPVRFHDVAALGGRSNFDLLEFHLSHRDLETSVREALPERVGLGLVVHSPDTFEGDHLLDLANPDPAYRCRSIGHLQRVVDLAREMKSHFASDRPLVVVNVGGVTEDGFVDAPARAAMLELVARSLAEVDAHGVEIIPQTFPPFPWHFGGQRFGNLLLRPDEIAGFCRRHGYRVCLDLSHSWMACHHLGLAFDDFLEQVAPHAAHLHLADSRGVDGEGLPIGEGLTDFERAAAILRARAPHASFIPEVWQGHLNGGEGFWTALQALEQWF